MGGLWCRNANGMGSTLLFYQITSIIFFSPIYMIPWGYFMCGLLLKRTRVLVFTNDPMSLLSLNNGWCFHWNCLEIYWVYFIFLSFICIYFSSCLMNCGNLPCIHLDIVNLSGSLQCLLWSKLWVYWFWRAWKCERCNFKDDTLLIWHYQNT